ncbi:hypothetical protein [Flavisericum labens]|uniref:hypothetical protein n=1 Tax=Flavisericum labens TaxID=3377112 RepID=UPI00387B503C
MIAELAIITGIVLGGDVLFDYGNSYLDVRVSTPEDYILVIFDADENSLDRFSKKGLFGKELLVEDSNIVHLGKSMVSKKDLRIVPPESWIGTYTTEGKYDLQGDSIHYTYMFKTNSNNDYLRSSQVYIDSLIVEELH